MKEISLHILDIAENSVNAGAKKIRIAINENLYKDELSITIEDDGAGMDAATAARITDPFVTSRTTRRVGLGIPFFKAAAEMCDGELQIQSEKGVGTTIRVQFRHSHIDRMPMGDIENTLLNLLIGYPDINWEFEYTINNKVFSLDDKEIKETLGEVPLSDPLVLKYLRETLRTGISEIKN